MHAHRDAPGLRRVLRTGRRLGSAGAAEEGYTISDAVS